MRQIKLVKSDDDSAPQPSSARIQPTWHHLLLCIVRTSTVPFTCRCSQPQPIITHLLINLFIYWVIACIWLLLSPFRDCRTPKCVYFVIDTRFRPLKSFQASVATILLFSFWSGKTIEWHAQQIKTFCKSNDFPAYSRIIKMFIIISIVILATKAAQQTYRLLL